MITAIDTNVLSWLLFSRDAEKAYAVSAALQARKSRGGLILCGLVYAELLALGKPDEVRAKLREMRIDVDPVFGDDILETAGAAWGQYARNRQQAGGRGRYRCECGGENTWTCKQCGKPLDGPKRVLADFLIGAHALHRAKVLLTYDRGVYMTYFPKLPLIKP